MTNLYTGLKLSKEESESVCKVAVNPHRPNLELSFYEDFTLRGIRVHRVEPTHRLFFQGSSSTHCKSIKIPFYFQLLWPDYNLQDSNWEMYEI